VTERDIGLRGLQCGRAGVVVGVLNPAGLLQYGNGRLRMPRCRQGRAVVVEPLGVFRLQQGGRTEILHGVFFLPLFPGGETAACQSPHSPGNISLPPGKLGFRRGRLLPWASGTALRHDLRLPRRSRGCRGWLLHSGTDRGKRCLLPGGAEPGQQQKCRGKNRRSSPGRKQE